MNHLFSSGDNVQSWIKPISPRRDLNGRRFTIRRAYHWQDKGKYAAAAGVILDPDCAAMRFDNQLAEGQAQPGASPIAFRTFDLLEAVEDGGFVFVRNARAGIGHFDAHMVVAVK